MLGVGRIVGDGFGVGGVCGEIRFFFRGRNLLGCFENEL